MLKNILHILLYGIFVLVIIIILGFSNEKTRSKPFSGLRVEILGSENTKFIDSAFVANSLLRIIDSFPKQKYRDISLGAIENYINQNIYYVESAQVYSTIDGTLVVRVVPRVPLARVINSSNESFYIDTKGKLMRTYRNYTARVMVVSGHLSARYSADIDLDQPNQDNPNSRSERLLREIFILSDYINQHPFLRAWIDHIFVTPQGDFELTPKNGAHIIEFGDTADMAAKFDKLIYFYQHGLTRLGWNKYQRINLKYYNQVVCSN